MLNQLSQYQSYSPNLIEDYGVTINVDENDELGEGGVVLVGPNEDDDLFEDV